MVLLDHDAGGEPDKGPGRPGKIGAFLVGSEASRLRDRDGSSQVELVEAHIEELPFADGSFDAVLSNGVITSPRSRAGSSPRRHESSGPGRLAIADIVSGRALKERTRRNVELWAACIAGAIPRDDYLNAIETEGLQVNEVRKNDHRFISERALDACSTYEVESISLGAARIPLAGRP